MLIFDLKTLCKYKDKYANLRLSSWYIFAIVKYCVKALSLDDQLVSAVLDTRLDDHVMYDS